MSEKLPLKPKRQGLKFKGMLDKLFPTAEQKQQARYDKMSEEYRALQRDRLDKRPAGPGLKEYELDQDLFMRYMYESDKGRHPYFFDTFAKVLDKHFASKSDIQPNDQNEGENPFIKLMYSSAALSSSTRELDQWLSENTPQNGYFTPEMIETAIVDDPELKVQRRRDDQLEYWDFSDKEEEYTMTLSRPLDDQHPDSATPYLGVKYSTEYDLEKDELVSTPLVYNWRDPAGKAFTDRLMLDLNLQPIRLHQKIDFHVVDAKPVPYFGGPDAQSLESIIADVHVVADLPEIA